MVPTIHTTQTSDFLIRPNKRIGMLPYMFLMESGRQDIVIPMLNRIDVKEVAVLHPNQNTNPSLSISASLRSAGKIEDILLFDSSQDEGRTSCLTTKTYA